MDILILDIIIRLILPSIIGACVAVKTREHMNDGKIIFVVFDIICLVLVVFVLCILLSLIHTI